MRGRGRGEGAARAAASPHRTTREPTNGTVETS